MQRPADAELLRQILAGRFCYVLTTRQMGKSSLMIRTAERLRAQRVRTVTIDLSGLGTSVTQEQWYLGILKRFVDALRLPTTPELWWQTHGQLGAVQVFVDFLHDVVLETCSEPVVVFLDEIDVTLKLDFTDDFFAAIRLLYNLRASQPEYERLTFVLLGVAAPSDLIKDRSRTPFNIGEAITLEELDRSAAQPLEQGLAQIAPGQGAALLDRIFFWTGGHPYLTQRLCLELAERGAGGSAQSQVDRLVEQLFLDREARKESNLQFVRSSVAASTERRALLRLYRRIYDGALVANDDRSPLQNRLKLIGLVRDAGGRLVVRNAIYRRAFDRAWVREQTPFNWAPLVVAGSTLVSLLALLVAFTVYRQQAAQQRLGDLRNLARLCRSERPAAHQEARRQFYEQHSPREQIDLFSPFGSDVVFKEWPDVVRCLEPALDERVADPAQRQELAKAMCRALSDSGAKGSPESGVCTIPGASDAPTR